MMVRLVFHRPLRQTEGLPGSLLNLMGIDQPVPDHATISRKSASSTALPAGPIIPGIDSTGMKVFGAGEPTRRDRHIRSIAERGRHRRADTVTEDKLSQPTAEQLDDAPVTRGSIKPLLSPDIK